MTDVNTGTVSSPDGTTIAYLQLGHGPGVVVLHGAMESASSHVQLAEALADAFTIYLPDRRGRGASAPCGDDHTVDRDVEDVAALLAKTDAHAVVGVSSGAIIALEAALALPDVHRVACYEPPLSLPRADTVRYLAKLDRNLTDGNVPAALVTGMKGARMGPAAIRALPDGVLELLTRVTLRKQSKNPPKGAPTMRQLAPSLRCDFQVVAAVSERLERYAAMTAEVLLLGGGRSPAYLTAALDSLEQIVPAAERVTFAGLGHGGSGNADAGGRPERVAVELRHFCS